MATVITSILPLDKKTHMEIMQLARICGASPNEVIAGLARHGVKVHAANTAQEALQALMRRPIAASLPKQQLSGTSQGAIDEADGILIEIDAETGRKLNFLSKAGGKTRSAVLSHLARTMVDLERWREQIFYDPELSASLGKEMMVILGLPAERN